MKRCRTQAEAAAKACFHTLKGLDMRPLSREAQRRALAVLGDVKRCLARRGHVVGKPIVKPMKLGRWLFGFDRAPGDSAARDQHACGRSTTSRPG